MNCLGSLFTASTGLSSVADKIQRSPQTTSQFRFILTTGLASERHHAWARREMWYVMDARPELSHTGFMEEDNEGGIP